MKDFFKWFFQGNRVQATVRTKELINKFRLLIDEGSCYRISNFGVGENGGKFPFLNHKFKIAFFKNTDVTRVVGWDKNTHGFKFEPFTNLQTKSFIETDVVGELLLFKINPYMHKHSVWFVIITYFYADVTGTIVSITGPLPFNNFRVDKIRRNVLPEDVE